MTEPWPVLDPAALGLVLLRAVGLGLVLFWLSQLLVIWWDDIGGLDGFLVELRKLKPRG